MEIRKYGNNVLTHGRHVRRPFYEASNFVFRILAGRNARFQCAKVPMSTTLPGNINEAHSNKMDNVALWLNDKGSHTKIWSNPKQSKAGNVGFYALLECLCSHPTIRLFAVYSTPDMSWVHYSCHRSRPLLRYVNEVILLHQ